MRSALELLHLLKEHTPSILGAEASGLCGTVAQLHARSLLNWKEKILLIELFLENIVVPGEATPETDPRTIRESERFSLYYWRVDELEPRMAFIDYLIEKFESNHTN